MKVDHSLVDPHLEPVPRLGTLTARCFTCGDAQRLRRHAHGPLDAQLLFPRLGDEVRADLLKRAHVPRGQGDPDAVDGCGLLPWFLGIVLQIRLQENLIAVSLGCTWRLHNLI